MGARGHFLKKSPRQALAGGKANMTERRQRRVRAEGVQHGLAVHESPGAGRHDREREPQQVLPPLHAVEDRGKRIFGHDHLAPMLRENLRRGKQALHGVMHAGLPEARAGRSIQERRDETVAQKLRQAPPAGFGTAVFIRVAALPARVDGVPGVHAALAPVAAEAFHHRGHALRHEAVGEGAQLDDRVAVLVGRHRVAGAQVHGLRGHSESTCSRCEQRAGVGVFLLQTVLQR